MIAFNNVDLLMLVDDLRAAARADLHLGRRDGPVADDQAEGRVARRPGLKSGKALKKLVGAARALGQPAAADRQHLPDRAGHADRHPRPAGCGARTASIVGVVLNVLVFFVLAEAVPKTYAVLYPQKAALFTARPVSRSSRSRRCAGSRAG